MFNMRSAHEDMTEGDAPEDTRRELEFLRAEVKGLIHERDVAREACVNLTEMRDAAKAALMRANVEILGLWSIVPGCAACREFYDAKSPVDVFAPRHTASTRCQSGRRDHCTCDTCF